MSDNPARTDECRPLEMDENLKKKQSIMEGKGADEKRMGVVLLSNNSNRARIQDDDPQQTNVSPRNNNRLLSDRYYASIQN
eukprot:scaffold86288_cov39-Attheya_sp.AAC.2